MRELACFPCDSACESLENLLASSVATKGWHIRRVDEVGKKYWLF